MIEKILDALRCTIIKIVLDMGVTDELEVMFEIPKDTNFGDYSTNIAMRLAKTLKMNPKVIAEKIVEGIDCSKFHLSKIEIAGNGFINLYLDKKYLSNIVFKIIKDESEYGKTNFGNNKKINIEFVSANPTGYLHIGHCRGAAYGDSLARIMMKAGYEVTKEFYVNDAGNQIINLANSIYERYKQLFGLDYCLGEDLYHGQEIIAIAQMIKDRFNDYYLIHDYQIDFKKMGVDFLLKGLRKDLEDFGVVYDVWFSEQSLYDNNTVEKTVKFLIDSNFTYEKDGAIWLKTSLHGDEKDRVIIKTDGKYTYVVPDIAYHANKLSRGYDHLIDVLGADHHGYINRLRAAITFVGGNADLVDIEMLQMVRVLQDGQEIKMSKRSGKAITLRDLIDEVGSDAIRYIFVSKGLSTQMDLDLDLAVKNTNENPVYYVQYAYARICSVFRVIEEKNIKYNFVNEFKLLDNDNVSKIIMILLQYPSYVNDAADKHLPHKICQYAYMLANALHVFYNDEKIITDNLEELNEKITLLRAIQIVLKDSLLLIGVNTKEKM